MTDYRIEHNGELDEMTALIASVPCEERSHRLVLLRKVIQGYRRLLELNRQEILLKMLAELVEAMQNDSDHKLAKLFKSLSNYAQAQANGDPLEQVISELGKAMAHSLNSALEVQREAKEDDVNQLLVQINQLLKKGDGG